MQEAVADAVMAVAGVRVVECPKLKWASERETFVKQEVAGAGGSISDWWPPVVRVRITSSVGVDISAPPVLFRISSPWCPPP